MQDPVYDKNESYGDDINSAFARRRLAKTKKLLKRLLAKHQIKKCLDIGSGTGYFSGFIKEADPKVDCYGVDISTKAVAIAKVRYPAVTFLVDTVTSFAEKERSRAKQFDLILSLENIEHIYNLDEYLSSVKKLLAPGGLFIVSTPNLNSYFNRLLILFGRVPYFQEYFLYDFVPIFSVGGRDFPKRASVPSGHIRILNCSVLNFIAKKYNFLVLKKMGAALYAHKKVFGFIDWLFSFLPSLASDIIYVYKNND